MASQSKASTRNTNRKAQDDSQENTNDAVVTAKGELSNATEAAMQAFKDYARARPEVVALWAVGVGFVLGWKLKPW